MREMGPFYSLVTQLLFIYHYRCGFLTLWPLVGGVLVPLAILILYDTLIFALVMRRLTRKVAGKQITKPKYIERLRRLHNAMALIVLMGLTWGVGYLTSIQVASLAFQIIFIILNSLQGVYLFLFYCLRNPTARTHWRNLLCPRRMPSRENRLQSSAPARRRVVTGLNLNLETLVRTRRRTTKERRPTIKTSSGTAKLGLTSVIYLQNNGGMTQAFIRLSCRRLCLHQ